VASVLCELAGLPGGRLVSLDVQRILRPTVPTQPFLCIGRRMLDMSARVVVFATLAAIAAGGTLPSTASAERAFAKRFGVNDNGGITVAANTLMTCPPPCAAAHVTAIPSSGSVDADNNNNYTMQRVDVDDDATTTDSSTATLSLPPGATVLFAGLYWSADTIHGVNGADALSAADRNTVKLRVPGASGYQAITASVLDDEGTRYQGFADVTTLVAAAGGGLYGAADVQAATGQDRYAGWSLVVAYHDDAAPANNLTIFDGLRVLSGSVSSISIPVSGFQTTPSGTVDTTLGVVAYEGDLGLTGDGMRLNGQVISDALNPPSNVFDSTVSVRGTRVMTGRDPAQENTFGFDADLLNADGLLANNATSATIALTTGGETYYPAVLSFTSELRAPHITTAATVEDLNGGQIEPGDVLEYVVDGTNDGTDTAAGVQVSVEVPAGVDWVPGSLQIVSGDGAGVLTDTAGDDRGTWDPVTRRVTWTLGAGATTDGGSVAVNDTFRTRFRVIVPATTDGHTLTLSPSVTVFSSTASPTDTYTLTGTGGLTGTVHSADLATTIAHTGTIVRGAHVDYTVSVANSGSGASHGEIVIEDVLPDDLTLDGTPSGDGWTCTADGRHVRCTRADSVAPGAQLPAITIPTRVGAGADPTVAMTATVSGGGDGTHDNDAATDTGTAVSHVDLGVAITPPAAAPIAGASSSYSAVITNHGPSPASAVTVTVPIPAGYSAPVLTIDGATGHCAVADGHAVCTLDALASGAQATITVRSVVAQGMVGFPLMMSGEVQATEDDTDPSNDQASASTSIGSDSNVGISILAPDGPVLAGETIDYSISVSNAGPSDAHDVVVTQELPPGAVLVDPDGRCVVAGRTVTCTLGTVAAGQSVILEFTVRADQAFDGRTLGTGARVRSSTGDTDTTNNAAVRPPGRCLSRRSFDIRLRVPYTSRKVKVLVDGRAAKIRRKGGRIRVAIDLRGRLSSHVTVAIAAITPNNYKISGSRRYRTCDIRRPTVKPPTI
jgi:uncharacterized repeat protein (TIGR01451 family)